MKILFLHLTTVNRENSGYTVTTLGFVYLMYTRVHEMFLLIILEENLETVSVRVTYLVHNMKSYSSIFFFSDFCVFYSHIHDFVVDFIIWLINIFRNGI